MYANQVRNIFDDAVRTLILSALDKNLFISTKKEVITVCEAEYVHDVKPGDLYIEVRFTNPYSTTPYFYTFEQFDKAIEAVNNYSPKEAQEA